MRAKGMPESNPEASWKLITYLEAETKSTTSNHYGVGLRNIPSLASVGVGNHLRTGSLVLLAFELTADSRHLQPGESTDSFRSFANSLAFPQG